MITKTNYLEKFTNQGKFEPDLDFLSLFFEKTNMEKCTNIYNFIIPEIEEALNLYEYEQNDLTDEDLINEIRSDSYYVNLDYWFEYFSFSKNYFDHVLREITNTEDASFYEICSEAQTIWRQEIYNAVRLILLNETN